MTSPNGRESSILTGGPRDGRAYWTGDLDAHTDAHRPHTEGYERTAEFAANPDAPTGVSRVWRWRE